MEVRYTQHLAAFTELYPPPPSNTTFLLLLLLLPRPSYSAQWSTHSTAFPISSIPKFQPETPVAYEIEEEGIDPVTSGSPTRPSQPHWTMTYTSSFGSPDVAVPTESSSSCSSRSPANLDIRSRIPPLLPPCSSVASDPSLPNQILLQLFSPSPSFSGKLTAAFTPLSSFRSPCSRSSLAASLGKKPAPGKCKCRSTVRTFSLEENA